MHIAITEELMWLLHQERVNAGVRAWLISQVPEKSREEKGWLRRHWRLVPLGLRPANCR